MKGPVKIDKVFYAYGNYLIPIKDVGEDVKMVTYQFEKNRKAKKIKLEDVFKRSKKS